MNTIRSSHKNLIRELQQEMFPLLSWFNDPSQNSSSLSQEGTTAWAPRVNIREEEKEFVVLADIPGVDPNSIDIEMDGNTLTLKGERSAEKEEKGKNYYRTECLTGSFYRQFTLPESVDPAKITATSKHGVLSIHLPKTTEGKHYRKIQIQSEGEQKTRK